jgi:hypothetical protein
VRHPIESDPERDVHIIIVIIAFGVNIELDVVFMPVTMLETTLPTLALDVVLVLIVVIAMVDPTTVPTPLANEREPGMLNGEPTVLLMPKFGSVVMKKPRPVLVVVPLEELDDALVVVVLPIRLGFTVNGEAATVRLPLIDMLTLMDGGGTIGCPNPANWVFRLAKALLGLLAPMV